MRHDVALALTGLGVLVVVAACLGALAVSSLYTRIHFLTPVTSAGGPLIGLGLIVQNGVGFTSAQLALIVVLLFGSGAALAAATGRLLAQHDGLIDPESPE